MTSRIPEPESEFEADGIPDPGDSIEGQAAAGEEAYELSVPGDRAEASVDFGTTAYEEEHGENLDGRLAREVPDVLNDESVQSTPTGDDLDTPYRDPETVGRLVEDDEGAHEDTTAETIAHDVGTDLGGYSAEESAMHLTSGDEE
ncbi:MAG TPA: DUF5709 domain-containing protein [Frankiaceae bacterium]|nr:DUF5709 domain-containing protein [Frankiaceae bacterium]